MKKVSIIILLTALILGAFTACNGDVFSDLMPEPEPEPKRVITLEIPDEDAYWADFSFDDTEDVKTKELEIPEDCKTWEEYLEKVTDIAVYEDGSPLVLNTNFDDKVYFGVHKYGLLLDGSKYSVPDTVDADSEIEIGGTYTLTHPLT